MDLDHPPIALTEAAFARLCEAHRKTEAHFARLCQICYETEEHPDGEQGNILRRLQDVNVRARTFAEAIAIITGENVLQVRQRARRQP